MTTALQTPCDGALNQHVRRKYGYLDANMLLNKMHQCQIVPTTTPADSLRMMHEIWRDIEIHKTAATL